MTLPIRSLIGAALTSSALLLACAAGPEQSAGLEDGGAASVTAGDTYNESAIRDLDRVRSVTMKYHDIDAAHQAGYPRSVPRCLDNPPVGGMGLHYINSALVDDSLDVEHPEILVYAPTPGGKPKLVGVEYMVPLSQWDAPQPPRIFDRPLKRSEALQIWYLHVWAWEANRNGLFADWNPAVVC